MKRNKLSELDCAVGKSLGNAALEGKFLNIYDEDGFRWTFMGIALILSFMGIALIAFLLQRIKFTVYRY